MAAPERECVPPGSEKIFGNLSLTRTWQNDTNTGVGKSGTVEPSNRKPSGQEHDHTGVPGAILMPVPTRAHAAFSA